MAILMRFISSFEMSKQLIASSIAHRRVDLAVSLSIICVGLIFILHHLHFELVNVPALLFSKLFDDFSFAAVFGVVTLMPRYGLSLFECL